ncbi:class IV lanthionine synthetase LanL [Dactylosporangium sucinum]|uniref:non-specific serine/threonine protein kinase n=1 Tax=Dactylosporangium sucinum TaxID=1424081 RepID=A0A917U573_9ACTN|nr:class IV lanthionine synthetase LanL [Dactylosporangium sucinum]GGM55332.1 serine/threonine protein kinase [Dactylosporangium sucinum]
MGQALTADAVLLTDVVRGVLDRNGGQRWTVQPTPAWCHLTAPTANARRHGWKLHVSATPLAAPVVLARAAEVLVRAECSFKFGTDLARVAQLVDAWYDRGGAGKFITAYPADDDEFRVLAQRLHDATRGLPGPRILSDRPFRPGSLVHYRYGEFHSERVFTDDGVMESRMAGPDGTVVKDVRAAWFSPPPWAAAPFPDRPAEPDTAPDEVLLGGRFRIREAIRHANKGGVYRAVDDRDGADVVIKQARAHAGALLDGTDARDRLRDEARLLDELAPLAVAPAKVALFAEQGDLFLAQEFLPGETLDAWARRGNGAEHVAELGLRLIDLVREVHDAGLVIRDLKPQNVLVSPFDEVHLIDVEFVTPAGRDGLPVGTAGFLAPELREPHGEALAGPISDCFSLGATLFCAVTGLGPSWVSATPGVPRPAAERAALLDRIARTFPGVTAFAPVLLGLTDPDPQARWTLKRAEEHLMSMDLSAVPAEPAPPPEPDGVDRLIADGLTHLRRGMTPSAPALWPQRADSRDHDAANLWTGAAGSLAVLTRAARHTADPQLGDAVAKAAAWLDERLFAAPRLLPGLCYGRAGTAWALHDAGRYLGDDRLTARAADLAGRLPLAWHSADVTHGLSGAGLAHLRMWRDGGDPALGERAAAYADAVIAAAERDGDDWHWPTAAAADSKLAGHASHGFAHGVAGAGTFLLLAGKHLPGGGRYLDAAVAAGETLARAAQDDRGRVAWPLRLGGDLGAAGHWCSGPAGIGTFLIRLWDATGAEHLRDLALRCADACLRELWSSTAGACCGLAGVGQFLLDLADHTGDAGHRDRAGEVAAVLHARRQVRDGLVLTCEPELGFDYGYGPAGVLDFLLRLRHGGANPWWS